MRQAQSGAVGASRTVAARLARGALLALAAAGFLSLSGAFGSGGAPTPLRTLYWLVVMLAGAAVGGGVGEVFARRGWLDGPIWRTLPALTLAIAAPMTLVVWLLSSTFFGDGVRLRTLGAYALPVLAVSAVLTTLNLLTGRTPPLTHAAAPARGPAAPPPAPARFLDRLPLKLRGAELYAVAAEDHYLRLHTSRGSDLILLRLADAVAELEGIEGAQTHRSWWVARGAVRDAKRGDGRAVLVLTDGTEAPVSRTYAAALRQAGWF